MLKQKSDLRVKRAGIVSVMVMAMLLSGMFAMTPAVDTVKGDILGGEYGGDLRVALKAEPNTLNPLSDNANDPALQVMDLIYDSLGRIDPYTLELKPWIASGWAIDTANSSRVSVTLRNDVKWHDGTSITTADVVYTYGASGHDVAFIDEMVEDVANNTVIFMLDAPTAKFFSEAMTMKLVPNGYADGDTIGCGPFIYDSASSDDTMTVLTANDDYFNGRPYLDSIKYTYYPYDDVTYPPISSVEDDPRAEGVYRAGYDLITGELDLIGWDLSSNDTTMNIEVPHGTDNYTNMVQYENASVLRSNGQDFWYLGMNCAPGHELNDPALRTAISHAIDKAALTVFDIGGGLEVTDSIVSKYDTPWYNSSITKYAYDVTEANSILNEAGYFDYDGDGWRDMPDQSPITFTLLGPPAEEITPNVMAGIITDWIRSIGINTVLVSNTTDVHMTDILADNFDLYLATETRTDLDPQFLEMMFSTEGVTLNDNLVNFQPVSEVYDEVLNDVIVDGVNGSLMYSNIISAEFFLDGVPTTAVTLDMDTGEFAITGSMDLANETLTANYTFYEFDHLIEMSNKQMDVDERARYIKEAQGFLSEQIPEVPLFSFRVNHAYNNTKYVGWVQTLGGINNFWTFINLRNPLNEGNMEVIISVPPDVTSDGATVGDEFNLNIKVEDIDGNPIDGVDLTMTGEGIFGDVTYNSDNAVYVVPYTVPDSDVSRTITLTITAAKVTYGSGSGTVDITVHPVINEFKVEVSKGTSSLDSGNETTVTFQVYDSQNAPVEGASVQFIVSPSSLGGWLSAYSGVTDANGMITVTFGAKNVTVDTTFKITAKITAPGFNEAEKSTNIAVSKEPSQIPDTNRGLFGLPAPSVLMVLLAFAGMALVMNVRRRK